MSGTDPTPTDPDPADPPPDPAPPAAEGPARDPRATGPVDLDPLGPRGASGDPADPAPADLDPVGAPAGTAREAVDPEAPFRGEQLLPPAARWLFHVRYLVSLVVVLVPGTLVLGFASTFVLGLAPAGVLVAALLLLELLYTIWWPSLSYERFRWELRDDALIVSQGVLFRDRTAIPLGRVQHVDVRQGPLEQWLSLARVHVHTASGVGADGAIPGLQVLDAERLRDELVARVGEADDGV